MILGRLLQASALCLALTAAASGAGLAAQSLVPPQGRVSSHEASMTLLRLLIDKQDPASLDEAKALMADLAKARPDDPELWASKGDVEAALGHAGRARDLYRRASELGRGDRGLTLRQADRMLLWGDYYGAERLQRDLLERFPGDLEARLGLARTLLASQRFQEARGVLRELAELPWPGLTRTVRVEALVLLARVAMETKEFEEAASHAGLALAEVPDNAEAGLLRARALLRAGRGEEAAAAFQALTSVKEAEQRAWVGLGKAYGALGDEELAQEAFSVALSLKPDDPEALCLAKREQLLAGGDLERIASETPSARGLHDWAVVLADNGHFPEAVAMYEAALRLDPDHFPSRMGLAETLASAVLFDRAIRQLQELRAEFPDSAKVRLALARVLGWSRRYDESLAAYAELGRDNPRDSVARREAARTAAWAKDMDRAGELYRELYSPTPDQRLASALAPEAGRADSPELASALGELRRSAEQGGVYQGSERFVRRFEELEPSLDPDIRERIRAVLVRQSPSYAVGKAASLERQGKEQAWNLRFIHAARTLEELNGFEPGNEEALFDLAQAQCALGLCDEEAGTYERLLDMDPLHSLAGYALGRQRLRSSPALGTRYLTWEEEGRGELAQMSRHEFDVWLDVPLLCRHLVTITHRSFLESPGRHGGPYLAQGPALDVVARVDEHLTVAAGAAYKQYSGDPRSTGTGHAKVSYNLDDYAVLALGYERRDEAANEFALLQGSQSDRWRAEMSSNLDRDVEARMGGTLVRYDDGNSGRTADASLSWDLTDHPRRLTATVSGEYRDTEEKSVEQYSGPSLVDIEHPYWTPQDYLAGEVMLQFRHDLARLFFCGAPAHYYDVRAATGINSDDNSPVRLEGEYLLEFLERWTFRFQSMLHRSREWDAWSLLLGLSRRF